MSGTDHLRVALEEIRAYREQAVCGTCRGDAEAMIDMLAKDIEFETLMRQYVASGMSHPKAAEVPERSKQIGEARDEVARRVGVAAPEAPRPAPAPRGFVRGMGQDLLGMLPRPRDLLTVPKRGRA